MNSEDKFNEYSYQLHKIADEISTEYFKLKTEARYEGIKLKQKDKEYNQELKHYYNCIGDLEWIKLIKKKTPFYLRWIKLEFLGKCLNDQCIGIHFCFECNRDFDFSCTFTLCDLKNMIKY